MSTSWDLSYDSLGLPGIPTPEEVKKVPKFGIQTNTKFANRSEPASSNGFIEKRSFAKGKGQEFRGGTLNLVTSVPEGGARTNAPGRTVVPVAPPGPDQRTKIQVGRSLSTYKLDVMQQSRQQQPQQQQSYSQQPRNGTLELQKHETKYGKRNTNAGNNGNGSNRRNSTGDSLANLGGGQESNYQQQPAQGSNYQQHSNSINSAMKSLQPTKSNSKLPASSQSGLSNPRAAPNMHGPNSSSAASQRKASTCQDSRGAGNSLVPAEFGAYRNPGDWARSNTPVRVPRNTRSGGSGGSGGKSKPRGEVEVVDLLDDDDDICEVVQGVGGQEAQGGNSASAWMGEAHSVPVERLYFGRYCKEVRESPNTDADADADADDTDLGLTGPLLRVEGCRLVVRSRAKFSASSSSSAFDEDVMMFDDVKKIICCTIEKSAHEHEAFIALSVKKGKSSAGVISVASGTGMVWDQTCTTDPGSKFILMMTTLEAAEIFHKAVKHLDTTGKVVTFLKDAGQGGEFMQAHTGRGEYRAEDMLNRVRGELEKQNKLLEKRRTRGKVADVVDPNDAIVYTLYPTEAGTQDVITLHQGDLKRLPDGEYLNDSLIDLKIKYLMRETIDDATRGRFHSFSCQFFTRLISPKKFDVGHGLVSRWTKNVDLFSRDFILVPINMSLHWSLAVVIRPGALLGKLERLYAAERGELLKKAPALGEGEAAEVEEAKAGVAEAKAEVKAEAKAGPKSGVKAGASSSAGNGEDLGQEFIGPAWPAEAALAGAGTGNGDRNSSNGNGNGEGDGDVDGNETCIVHMDSLNMHGPSFIQKWLRSYLRFEWEARKMPAVGEKLTTTLGALNKIAGVEPQADGGGDNASKGGGSASKGKGKEGSNDDWSAKKEANFCKQLEAKRKKIFEEIQFVKCKVPVQKNGYDCGVFVNRYAEMVLRKLPTSTLADIDSKFRTLLPADEFTQKDIFQERTALRELLAGIKVQYDERCRLEREQKLLERGKKAEAAGAGGPAATPGSTSVNTEDTSVLEPMSAPISEDQTHEQGKQGGESNDEQTATESAEEKEEEVDTEEQYTAEKEDQEDEGKAGSEVEGAMEVGEEAVGAADGERESDSDSESESESAATPASIATTAAAAAAAAAAAQEESESLDVDSDSDSGDEREEGLGKEQGEGEHSGVAADTEAPRGSEFTRIYTMLSQGSAVGKGANVDPQPTAKGQKRQVEQMTKEEEECAESPAKGKKSKGGQAKEKEKGEEGKKSRGEQVVEVGEERAESPAKGKKRKGGQEAEKGEEERAESPAKGKRGKDKQKNGGPKPVYEGPSPSKLWEQGKKEYGTSKRRR